MAASVAARKSVETKKGEMSRLDVEDYSESDESKPVLN